MVFGSSFPLAAEAFCFLVVCLALGLLEVFDLVMQVLSFLSSEENPSLDVHSLTIRDIQEQRSQLSSGQEVRILRLTHNP